MTAGNGNNRPVIFPAYWWNLEVRCVGCLPEGVVPPREDLMPIRPRETWGYIPKCEVCGKEHDYITPVSEDC